MVRSTEDPAKELCKFSSDRRLCRCDALQGYDYNSAWGKLLLTFLHIFWFNCFVLCEN